MSLAFNFAGPELLIVLAVVLLLFGAKKVPELARGLGRAQREFQAGTRDDEPDDEQDPARETV
jgi:sec-independent protein translocase protein TatA